MRSTSTSTSRTLLSPYASATGAGLRMLAEISLWVALTKPTRQDVARRSSSPDSASSLRCTFMSVRMVSAQRSTVLCRHHASCCPCTYSRSCAGWRRHLTMARATSSSRQGLVRMMPGITRLHGANSERTSCPRFRGGISVASTYSKGTRLRPWRMAQLTSACDTEKSAQRGAKASFSSMSTTAPGSILLMASARARTSRM
mmetsp:Transcript_6798/g.21257  ORF Transcript_6798/g.21257 Transcript_6798/m.21257 type:complete len:201 (+) Transcript_6798:816-1418(+)